MNANKILGRVEASLQQPTTTSQQNIINNSGTGHRVCSDGKKLKSSAGKLFPKKSGARFGRPEKNVWRRLIHREATNLYCFIYYGETWCCFEVGTAKISQPTQRKQPGKTEVTRTEKLLRRPQTVFRTSKKWVMIRNGLALLVFRKLAICSLPSWFI